MSKLYTIAGTSTLNGVNTYRFATGKLNIRVSKLKRHGHNDVQLMTLPAAMNKKDAVAWLVAQGIAASIPRTGRGAKTVELTPEQTAAAVAAAAQNAAAAAAREQADADYVDGLTDATDVANVPADVTEHITEQTIDSNESYSELLDAVSGELGVDADRAVAEEMLGN